MQNTRFLKAGLIVLLLMNLGIMSYLWLDSRHRGRPPGGPNGPDVFRYLSQELKLDDAQVKQYEVLRDEHHHAVENIQEHGHQLREQFFNMMNQTPIDSVVVKRIADSIAHTQEQIEMATFYHFSKLRTILTPEQQKHFDEVIQEALRMMAGPPPPRR
jgi:protein CpxP